MRVLFLDIDGVLNSARYFEQAASRGSHEDHIDPSAISILNTLFDECALFDRCDVVISSTWRLMYKLGNLQRILGARGFKGRIVGATPELSGSLRRGAEIAQWLSQHPEVESYAIVDDDHDAGEGHPGRFVQTSFGEGITSAHVDKLISILSKEG